MFLINAPDGIVISQSFVLLQSPGSQEYHFDSRNNQCNDIVIMKKERKKSFIIPR
jgi:hypothetical protein